MNQVTCEKNYLKVRNDMKTFCCEDMKSHVYLREEDAVLDDGDKEDKVIFYYSSDDEYGIPIADLAGGFISSYIVINHCPWCGKALVKNCK